MSEAISQVKKNKIKKLEITFQKIAEVVDPKIKEILSVDVGGHLHDLVNYQILTGGKRLRPGLSVISCQLLGGKLEDVLYPAAGLEILHNYTLIFDDIIDNSNLRRGEPTVWAKFGRSIAQCVGIEYSASLFQAANRSKDPVRISEIFAKTIKAIVEGEILDILFEQQGREDEPYIIQNRHLKIIDKDYFEMIGKKTAVLFQACCQAGAICAGAKKWQIKALGNYGFNLGLAFQIQDDILDIFGEEGAKKIDKHHSRDTLLQGKDIIERKGGNIVILLALRELSKKEKEKILKIMRKDKIQKKDIEEAIKLIQKTKSLKKASLLGKIFIEKARKNLNSLPQNKWNDTLREVADFVMARKK